MLLFFTIIFQGGIILHYLVKDRIVSVLKISEHISIILYRRKSVFQTSIIYFVTNNSKISQVIYESN